MTDDELNEIEARANKTTSGKWVFYYSSESTLNNDDMDFLAHCRKDVPELIAEVRQLRAEREVLVRALVASDQERLFKIPCLGSGKNTRSKLKQGGKRF